MVGSLCALMKLSKAYWDYDPCILTRIHAFQLETYREIIRNRGDNQFFQPHSDIRKRQREGAGTCDFTVSDQLYQNLVDTLANWPDD